MDAKVKKSKVVPFSLKDAPSLIERVWPVQKISVEAQKERKAGPGQTLTSLGSYWKGRKPLILVRACTIAALLPATGDDEKDLAIFELLTGLSDEQIADRFKTALTVEEVKAFATPSEREALLEDGIGGAQLTKLPKATRVNLMSSVLNRMPYQARADKLLRPEEVSEDILTGERMSIVNEYLGTDAKNLSELIEQLGIMRFGRRPRVGDTFSGGGSIPFEAARLGCDVYASDLNPIACMLTWGALNIVGASPQQRKQIEAEQAEVDAAVDLEIFKLGVEHDRSGNRAKAYLYCLETRCPQTGWLVPMLGTLLISKAWRTVARLVPDQKAKRFDIEIHAEAGDDEMESASLGTVRDGNLIYELDGESYSTSVKTIRGDYKGPEGETLNRLRKWEKSDFMSRPDDIFRERLYCVQWITKDTLDKPRQNTFFAGVGKDDLKREQVVQEYVREHLNSWQAQGFVPDMFIEPGDKTDEPIRTRGWTYWHHLFGPRTILRLGLERRLGRGPIGSLQLARNADRLSKLCRYNANPQPTQGPKIEQTFSNQALNTLINYGTYSFVGIDRYIDKIATAKIVGAASVNLGPAASAASDCEIWITDPPYADAVYYHEITEFFIAWLRKNPPSPFDKWVWDSRRPLAIKGDGEEFRQSMVAAYGSMANHMPENGLQIVMFTHQDAGVWADMAQIFWGAGLRVMAAWYIATETTSELKKGGYVQGTVILVLRKRVALEAGYKDEIVQEVKIEVADQIDTMIGLNQNLKGRGRIENLFEDADLQMAGYAAALRVLTRYATIDGVDMTKEALRVRKQGERGIVAEIIDFSVQVANEHMVPDGMPVSTWGQLVGAERFFFKMMDIESTGARKLDNYQNFSKAFRVDNYDSLMGNVSPNKARLKAAKEFKKGGFEGEFGTSPTRCLLFALFEIENEVDGDDVLAHLRDLQRDYLQKRDDLIAISDYIAKKRESVDEEEARAARILHGLIRNERLG